MSLKKNKVSVIIPAYNEEKSIGLVIRALKTSLEILPVDFSIIIGNNGSTDDTVKVAVSEGAEAITELERGYGAACLKALTLVSDDTEIIAFIDADYSDYPEEISHLLQPILENRADLVIGSRVLGRHERGALLPQARFGNWLSTRLIKIFWKYHFTDLGPFRAIRYNDFKKLNMKDRNFGWTVEMQIKAARHSLRCEEVPVSYRKRIGKSKVSGTLKGSIMAGYIILKTIFSQRFSTEI